MGHGVQEKKIAKYERRKQREAPGCHLKTLFDQNNVLRQTFTVTVLDGCEVPTDTFIYAMLAGKNSTQFMVTNCEGRRIGAIGGESGRVLAETFRENRLTTVRLSITGIIPVSGDIQVRIIPE
jgi:hypothetical protein